MRTPGSAKSPVPSSTPSSSAPSEAKRTAACCLRFSSFGSGRAMTGFAFASRCVAAADAGAASAGSALAGVEPKKEDRKLFFLGSIGAVGIVPAVRIGPPLSSTCPAGGAAGVPRPWRLVASVFAASSLAAVSTASAVFVLRISPLRPLWHLRASRRGGRQPFLAGSHRLRRQRPRRRVAGLRPARRPHSAQAPSTARWSRNRRQAARQEALLRQRCAFPRWACP